MKPHKHAELIKAWADGVQIQAKHISHLDWHDWHNQFMPNWDDDLYTYRIKPKPKSDFNGWMYVCKNGEDSSAIGFGDGRYSNLKLTFDGETGKLKSAEVLK